MEVLGKMVATGEKNTCNLTFADEGGLATNNSRVMDLNNLEIKIKIMTMLAQKA